jgi:4a-hydroxytetrahydrobiopterin dehydratase
MGSLTQAEIKAALTELKGWQLTENGEISKQYKFGNFVEAMAFVNNVAEIAEDLVHHPDIIINYNRVTLSVTTHDEGGLTNKDFALAARANATAGN